MTDASNPYHICASSDCDCGMTRRDFLRLSALGTASAAAPLLFAGDAMAQQGPKGDDQPVKIGYLPITDATPLLVAHGRKLFEAEGLQTETPRLFRSWAQIVEAFVSGQDNDQTQDGLPSTAPPLRCARKCPAAPTCLPNAASTPRALKPALMASTWWTRLNRSSPKAAGAPPLNATGGNKAKPRQVV